MDISGGYKYKLQISKLECYNFLWSSVRRSNIEVTAWRYEERTQ